MKKVLLALLLFASSNMVIAQANLITQVPQVSNGNTQLRAPNGLSTHATLRAHILLTQSEMSVINSGVNLTTLGFVLLNGITAATASGTLKIYVEATSDVTNQKSTTWTTAISTMTEVYDGTYNIPFSAGATNVDFTLDTPFAYTGTGLYVAYEYIASAFSTTPATYAANTDMAAGIRIVTTNNSTPGPVLTGSSSFRPCMRIGIPNPNSNDMEVQGILDPVGKVSSALQSTQSVVALVKNASNTTLNNVPVTMSVTGANAYSSTQTIATIGSGQEMQLTFTGLSTTANANQSISISVPNDDDNTDNLITHQQTVSCDTIGFYNNDTAVSAVGYNTGAGCLAIRHTLPNTAPVTITSIGMVLTDESSAVGNTLKGMLFDNLGNPIDSSAGVTITNAMLGTRMNFDLIHADSNLAGETVYFGIRQTANSTTGYFPCATQDDDFATLNRYYGLGVNGGNLTAYNTLGLFMFDAIVSPILDLESSTATVVCTSSQVTFDATSGFANYDFYVDGNLSTSGASSTFNFTPTDTHSIKVSTALNTCEYEDSTSLIVQYPDTMGDTVTICEGEQYEFDGQQLNVAGSYSATFQTIYGCDSTVNLELNVTDLLETELDVDICSGETYEHLGQTLNTTGVYIDTLTGSAGCDSIVTLDLAVNEAEEVSVSETICGYETYSFNGAELNIPGTYVDTFQTSAGCDSVVTLALAVNYLDLGILQTDSKLTALESDATYQWLKCNNDKEVNGATGRTHEFTASGSYKVVITKFGCTDTSDCMFVTGLGIGNLYSDSRIKLYPNPTKDFVRVTGSESIVSIEIRDISGKLVLQHIPNTGTNNAELNLSTLPSGTYTVHTISGHSEYNSQNLLIKQ